MFSVFRSAHRDAHTSSSRPVKAQQPTKPQTGRRQHAEQKGERNPFPVQKHTE